MWPEAWRDDPADLAAHPHAAELVLEHALHRAGDLGDGELRRVLRRARASSKSSIGLLACAATGGTLERRASEAKRGTPA